MVIIFGLCVVPCLYAWFNILSNWDPYGVASTSRVNVAVVSLDEGSHVLGVHVNIGEKVIDALKANNSIGWIFTESRDEALEMVYSGECYAALVIPEDFSGRVIGVTDLKFNHPEIQYYENNKKNAIAPKITGKAKSTVQQQVNSTFVKTLADSLTGVISVLDKNGVDYEQTLNSVSGQLLGFEESLLNVCDLLGAVSNVLENTVVTLDNSSTLALDVSNTLSSACDAIIIARENRENLADSVSRLLDSVSAASGNMPTIGNTDLTYGILYHMLEFILPSVRDSLLNASTALVDAQDALSSSSESTYNLSENLSAAASDLYPTIKKLTYIRSELLTAADKLESVADFLKELAASDYLKDLTNSVAENSETIPEFFASPIRLRTYVMYPIETYGSAMAPFYTVLSLWVGALFSAALLKARVRRSDLEGQLHGELNIIEEFCGRYVLFLFVSSVQAAVSALGNLYFIGMYCVHPVLFVAACLVTGLCFSLINFALLFSLEKIGLGASVIIMVIQVAGSGGSYPVDVVPKIFQLAYPFMPFNYAMNSIREAIAGTYGNHYISYIGMLLLISFLFFILGNLLYFPAHKLNEAVARSAEKSELLK